MRVLGIDPGSYKTGYGIVEKQDSTLIHIDNGIIKPCNKLAFQDRLYEIHKQIVIMLNRFEPDVVALEDIFVAKNVNSAIKLGHIRGIAILAGLDNKIKVAEYPPTKVKQAIVGIGNATKHQVQKMVQALLKLPEVAAEDASDALAVAICHLHSSKLQGILNTK